MHTKKGTVLITDKVHPLLIDGLEATGYIVEYNTSIDNEALDKIIEGYTGIIINSKILMDKQRIDLGTQLKFIARLGSGMEIVDIPYAERKGIKVYSSPEGNSNAVAEHEIGMLLGLLNHLYIADAEVRQMQWNREKNRGSELRGKTLGIIGLGHTGSALAEKMSSWRLNVISYDKYRKQYPDSLRFVEKVALEEVLNRADIISLHLPLSDETKMLVDEDFIQKCKDGVIISNTSRGQIVHLPDLIEALKSGKVAGACLDVFSNEKPSTYTSEEAILYKELFGMKNVVVSPHIAGWTHESLELIAKTLLDKIIVGDEL